jgi:tetratricopeptide (TPR) repeat protein
LTEYPEVALLSALSAAGADGETIRVIRGTKAPRKLWKLDLRLPKPTDYLYEIAGAMMWKNAAAAMNAIEEEAEKQPENPNVHLVYANLTKMEGDWIRAYGEAKVAVELAPEWPYAHGLRSSVCYHARLAECAVREATIFVRMRPEDAAAYIVLGHAQEMRGNFAEALEAYNEAKRRQPGYSAIYEGMGRVYGETGEFEKAVAAFEQAIAMEKGKAPEYSCELAQLYLAEGYARKAVETLRRAENQNPEDVRVLLALGNAYIADEQYPAAVKQFREVLEEVPDLEIARTQLAKALRAEGRSEEAEQVYLDADTLRISKQR